MTRLLAGLLGATASAIGVPAHAAQIVLTFDDVSEGAPAACTGGDGGLVDRQCNNGNWVGVDYGSTAQLAVRFDAGGSTTSLIQNSAYFAANGPIFSGAYNPYGSDLFSTTTFAPAAGFEIAFQSLTFFNPSATGGTRFFEVRDAFGTVIASETGSVGNGTYAPNTGYFSGPLTFAFRNEGGALIIDNVTVDVRGIASPSAVPEPAVWALMVAGFGMVGSTMRRRHAARHVTA